MCITSCRHINIRGANLVIIVASMLGMILFIFLVPRVSSRSTTRRSRHEERPPVIAKCGSLRIHASRSPATIFIRVMRSFRGRLPLQASRSQMCLVTCAVAIFKHSSRDTRWVNWCLGVRSTSPGLLSRSINRVDVIMAREPALRN